MDQKLLLAILALMLSFSISQDLRQKESLQKERASFAAQLAEKENEKTMLLATTTALGDSLLRTQVALLEKEEENHELSNKLGIVVEEKSSLEKSVGDIGEKIGILEKLTSTDKELLQKYSRVYFLNENYVPSSLATVTPEFVFEKNKVLYVHGQVLPHLERMMADAKTDEHPLLLVSAYRSFEAQNKLKTAYTVTYGSGANSFSADQGYSEHQLGTTVDFTSPVIGAAFTQFDLTGGYKWLTENAWKYGFVLSYPKNNAFYIYEPWHWRYVGVVLSVKLHQEGKYFYDLEQREIDKYLIDVF